MGTTAPARRSGNTDFARAIALTDKVPPKHGDTTTCENARVSPDLYIRALWGGARQGDRRYNPPSVAISVREGRDPYEGTKQQDSRTCGVRRLARRLQFLAKTAGHSCEPAACRTDADCGNGDVVDARHSGLH